MKKQILSSILSFILIAFASSVLSLGLLSERALAAPARCFDGTGVDFRELASCPTSNGYRSATNAIISTPTVDDCYQGNFTPGPNITVYVEGDCTGLSTLAVQVRADLCTTSGGVWSFTGTADNGSFSCACPSGKVLSVVSRQCVVPTPSSNSGSGSISRIEGPEADCQTENGVGDINESNCKIVELLNRIFNFVSGGIALAVIGNIIFAGIQYSMAQGDPSMASKSKNRIQGALIAFVMYLSLYAFLQWLIPGGVF